MKLFAFFFFLYRNSNELLFRIVEKQQQQQHQCSSELVFRFFFRFFSQVIQNNIISLDCVHCKMATIFFCFVWRKPFLIMMTVLKWHHIIIIVLAYSLMFYIRIASYRIVLMWFSFVDIYHGNNNNNVVIFVFGHVVFFCFCCCCFGIRFFSPRLPLNNILQYWLSWIHSTLWISFKWWWWWSLFQW